MIMEYDTQYSAHVVIVNWNGETDTKECLDSLYANESGRLLVTVIDNSDDHLPCINLKTYYDTTNFIFSDKNLGFASASNLGLEVSKRLGIKYTLFLNNDTVVIRSFIDEMIVYLEHHHNVGALSPFINYFHAPEMAWFHSSKIDLANFDIVHDSGATEGRASFVPWLSGCAFLGRTEILDKCGGFDSEFFLYSEDVDLSLKIRKLGFELSVLPIVAVLHKVGTSTNKVNMTSTYYAVRNKIIVVRRHFQANLVFFTYRLLRQSISSVFHSNQSFTRKVSFVFRICSAILSGLMWRV